MTVPVQTQYAFTRYVEMYVSPPVRHERSLSRRPHALRVRRRHGPYPTQYQRTTRRIVVVVVVHDDAPAPGPAVAVRHPVATCTIVLLVLLPRGVASSTSSFPTAVFNHPPSVTIPPEERAQSHLGADASGPFGPAIDLESRRANFEL